MNIFTLAVIIALLTLGLGAVLMWLIVSFSNTVKENESVIEQQEKERQSINVKQTAGHAIATRADYEEQLDEARRLAAKRAATLPRGANMGIGRLGTTDARKNKKSSSLGVSTDPMSAVKIAHFHSWNGLTISKQQVAAPTARVGGQGKRVKRKLEPGKDFEWTDIANLSGAEKRRAIIANAKAKATAYKAAKAAGTDTMVVSGGVQGAAPAAAAPAAPTVELPPAPELTVISDDLDPAEVRRARIANSKAKSAYNKQLKAVGIDPKDVEWTDEGPRLPPSAQPSAAAAGVATVQQPQGVPQATAPVVDLPPAPDLTVITDDMDPADIRRARIGNSKAKSAYNKQLKAAGIDPSNVEWTDDGPVLSVPGPAGAVAEQTASPVVPEPTAMATAVEEPTTGAPPPPDLVEITDDMDPADVRQARIANAKAVSAYKKQLKGMGIDPSTVNI